jgi:hypothetical protein
MQGAHATFTRRCAPCFFLLATLLGARPAHAAADAGGSEPRPSGKVNVPLDLIIHGKGNVSDVSFVVVGCGSADGQHGVVITGPSQSNRCTVKAPPSVYAIATKDVAPLQALLDSDAGAAHESSQAPKLLKGAMSCGTIYENTDVDRSVSLLTAHYMLTRTESDCSLSKVGDTVPSTEELRHPKGSPSNAAPQAVDTAAAATTEPSAAPSATPSEGGGGGGCSCVGCVVARAPRSEGLLASSGGLALVVSAWLRRARRRRSPRS